MTVATEQQLAALKKGNEVRLHNSKVKANVRNADPAESRRLAAMILENYNSDSPEGRILVTQLLQAIRCAGDTRVHRWLTRARIISTRRIGTLSDRQRNDLAVILKNDAVEYERRNG